MNPAKIHPTLLDELNLTVRGLEEAALPTLPIIVRLRPTRALGIARSLEDRPGLRVERRLELLSAVAGTATPDEVEALSESAEVEYLWYDEPVYALLNESVPRIGAPRVWQSGNQGEGIRICIVDTGVAEDHPDLAGRVVAARDFTGEGTGDEHGHGTHVAGIAAGSGDASEGRYRGVAPRALLFSAKVLRGDGAGRMSLVIAGLEWALEQGAQIINLSLGTRGNCDGTDATSYACDAAVEAGAIVIAAAGNEGPGLGSLSSPGCARRVITVGATTEDDMVADFSSRGPTLDGRLKPDVVLPGKEIVAPRAQGTSLGQPVSDLYTSMNGSSMAAPHAAGIAALMLVANPTLRPDEVKSLLRQAAVTLGLDQNWQGAGLVMADRAVQLARAAAPVPPPAPEPGPLPAAQPDGCFAPVARLFRGG